MKEDYAALGKRDFLISELQKEKVGLDAFTPQKVFKGKEVSSSYNQVKNFMSDVMRGKIHETIKAKKGIDSAKLYRDYANLD